MANRGMILRHMIIAATAAAFTIGVAPAAFADRIKHPTAVFAGLDKITGRIISFDVAIDETVQFGSLQITPRACYTRPPTEAPLTTGFVEADEITSGNEVKRIFAGWMFAASPGLHGIEHPVYDAWLTDCKGGKEVIPDPTPAKLEEPNSPPPPPKPGTVPRPRVPRVDPNAPAPRQIRPSLPPQDANALPQPVPQPFPQPAPQPLPRAPVRSNAPPGLIPPGDIPFDNRR
ncbi:DUF2155 domain-containing protein [Terripilifer ovatus]|uniref:DUF2155 domain-containing protein n=1 Tax=Terripilifer ovatus TaxID=3032367 RepID=UPI003AB95FFD